MLLRDIMSSPVLSLRPSDPASDAAAWLRDAKVRHAPVLDGAAIIGVVSDRDLGGPHGGATRKSRTVGDLMRAAPTVASPELDLVAAVALVRRERIGCLPVVEGGRVVGIVTRSDLLAALAHERRSDRGVSSRRPAEIARPPSVVAPNRDEWP